jgi:hypothetical protein
MIQKICLSKLSSLLILLVAIFPATPHAQDISGDWQGTLADGSGLRVILYIEKNAAEKAAAENDKRAPAKKDVWKATLYSIDQGPDGIPVSSVTFQDSTLKLGLDGERGRYEGKLSADCQSIKGVWIQGLPATLDFRRATKETAWVRDPSPHKAQFITVDINVKLEVLDWGGTGRPIVLLAGLGNSAHVFDKFALNLFPDITFMA